MKIILDTNFLLMPAQFKIDVFKEVKKFGKPVTIKPCIDELEKISKKKGKTGTQARTALEMIKKKIKIVKTREKNADRAILRYALKADIAVATNDRKLIKKLKNNGISVIRMRQRKYLVMV